MNASSVKNVLVVLCSWIKEIFVLYSVKLTSRVPLHMSLFHFYSHRPVKAAVMWNLKETSLCLKVLQNITFTAVNAIGTTTMDPPPLVTEPLLITSCTWVSIHGLDVPYTFTGLSSTRVKVGLPYLRSHYCFTGQARYTRENHKVFFFFFMAQYIPYIDNPLQCCK